jgi:peroxiredoxin family protein
MGTDTAPRGTGADAPAAITKVSIIVSKGSLEGVYPALIMANGARAEGIEANLFFTFFGMDAVHRGRNRHVKVATVGNPGMHIPTLLGALPGMSALATHFMGRRMDALDIPPIDEFIEMIADTGAGLYACRASVDMFGLTREDFVPQIRDIITVGEFYAMAAGGQIIFTSGRDRGPAPGPLLVCGRARRGTGRGRRRA